VKYKSIPALLCLLMLSTQGIARDVAQTEEIPAEKLDAIRELMRVTNAQANRTDFAAAFAQQMLSILRTSNPDLSEKAVQIVTDEVTTMVNKELDDESLQLMIYPIYARYLTLEELEGLIKFNESAVGKRANQVMPKLMQESLEAAQAWAQMVGPKMSDKVLERFQEEGIPVRAAQK
jgi:uncharacterized protein